MKNFVVQEFVPPDIYAQHGDDAVQLIDDELIDTIQAIRDAYGLPVTINTWHIGGYFMYRGYRPAHCLIGAAKSIHKVGKALDFTIKGVSPEKVRKYLLENSSMFPAIKRIEALTPSWVHIDTKDTGVDGIVVFNP